MGKNDPSDDPDPSQYLIVSLEQKRKDQTKPYDGKKMVWVPDTDKCFLLGEIQSTKGDVCTVAVKGDEVKTTKKINYHHHIMQILSSPIHKKKIFVSQKNSKINIIFVII